MIEVDIIRLYHGLACANSIGKLIIEDVLVVLAWGIFLLAQVLFQWEYLCSLGGSFVGLLCYIQVVVVINCDNVSGENF